MSSRLMAALPLFASLAAANGQLAIPQASDWVDRGLVFSASPLGEGHWDVLMEDYTPCTVLKKDGTFYMYYSGSSNYDSQKDNIGPAWRYVGVATSTDGIHWDKYAGNPTLTYSYSGSPEEGVPAAGFFFDTNGDVLTYYSASWNATATDPQVRSDIRVARSTDMFHFTDEGLIARYNDPAVRGSGDELHPVQGYTNGTNYYAFYIPNGVPAVNRLAAVWGSTSSSLPNSSFIMNSEGVPLVRGSASIVPLDESTLAFFNTYQGDLYVRTASATDPVHTMSAPVAAYTDIPGAGKIVYADTDSNTWFLYYNAWSYMGFATAPIGAPDATGPLAPTTANAAAANYRTVNLDWAGASDPETGVLEYNVYRDGTKIATTRDFSFQDAAAQELTSYNYEIRPVNLHGTEGAAAALNVTTPADLTPPGVRMAAASGDATLLKVIFDEAMNPATANDHTRYSLSDGVSVLSASLGPDGRTVTLTTTPQAPQKLYSLNVNGVRDAAAASNIGSPQARFTYSEIPGLIAHYQFDPAAGVADDTSGYEHGGKIKGSVTPVSGAASFDGATGFIEIDDNDVLDHTFAGSFTVTAWAKPDSVPPYTTASDRAYAVFTSPSMAIEYNTDQKFFARLATSNGQVDLLSTTFAPGAWHHLALVVDADAGQLCFYIDGNLVGAAPKSFAGSVVAPPAEEDEIAFMGHYYAQYRIGVADPYFDYEMNYFKGMIDDLRIFDRALSAAQVAAVMIPEPATMLTLLAASTLLVRLRR